MSEEDTVAGVAAAVRPEKIGAEKLKILESINQFCSHQQMRAL